VYSIYARHVPNMGYPYAPYTGHRHAKDTVAGFVNQSMVRLLYFNFVSI
jgi:hypothetical protein